ncbi:hypothetical protein [Halomicrobium urmianum]|uniref:hypothetical protein n=1 Tax=Halomicrobium urmianum TaxID=1586233 RepID=UPI001CD9FD1E|nr:hypothetical protein [Halomicrobium urmianum]
MGSPDSAAGQGTAVDGEKRTTAPQVDVGVLVAYEPDGDVDALRSFTERMTADARAELASATDADWAFYVEEPTRLPDSRSRRASEFLDDATHRMVEGPYDVTVVVTDVTVTSSRDRYVPGLASPLARTAVVSTRILRSRRRDEPMRALDAPAVRWNAATLCCHLVGHVLGARHADADGGLMEPFRFDPDRRSVPSFDATAERHLERIAAEVPDEEASPRGRLRRLAFHGLSAARNPRQVARALVDSRAPLLPLSLPKLATAAVAPTLVIVFSAESWDVGFHLDNATAGLFAVVSVFAAALYLLFVQNLSFPRERHRLITEHTALVNVTVFLILLGAMAGLFALVAGIMLVIEFVVFPPDLMANWPSLEDPSVSVVDMVRTGAFISTVGVLSGALAGGLENRAIVRHLALFHDRP